DAGAREAGPGEGGGDRVFQAGRIFRARGIFAHDVDRAPELRGFGDAGHVLEHLDGARRVVGLDLIDRRVHRGPQLGGRALGTAAAAVHDDQAVAVLGLFLVVRAD